MILDSFNKRFVSLRYIISLFHQFFEQSSEIRNHKLTANTSQKCPILIPLATRCVLYRPPLADLRLFRSISQSAISFQMTSLLKEIPKQYQYHTIHIMSLNQFILHWSKKLCTKRTTDCKRW